MTTRVELAPEQLPEQLRPLLVSFQEAQRRGLDAHQAVTRAPIPERHKLTGTAEEAAREAAVAHTALLEATRQSPTPMRDHSAAAYASCVEKAREALATAEAELRAAAGHASVYASVRPGKPLVNTERGVEAPGRQRAMLSVSLLREVVDSLPESLG
ncbi:hypothetical protein FNH09_23485 [Streptomyces adustus]|uniref:Uncharacterized protein n=1 Tax=Streptomyces adustus TaxID=1609272 RepID=A0A5N8VFV1_9ACTN|nr:hypothetical protein [Streptomyces adustus]MPY34101.1 hypothetical protein [Streptomyces adustus]